MRTRSPLGFIHADLSLALLAWLAPVLAGQEPSPTSERVALGGAGEASSTWITGRVEVPDNQTLDNRARIVVEARLRGYEAWRQELTPGPDGSFQFALPRDAEHPRIALRSEEVFLQPRRIRGDVASEPLVLAARPSGSLRGAVRAPEGVSHAFDEAVVRVRQILPSGGTRSTLPDSREVPLQPDGAFEVHGLGVGERYLVSVSSPRLRHAQAQAVAIRADEAVAVVLEPLRGVSVRGRVVDESGAGVEGVEVYARSGFPRNWVRRHRTGETDVDGRFELGGLEPGTIHVVADSPEHPVAKWTGELAEDGARRSGIELTLVPGLALAGRVVDAEGSPLGGCAVELGRESGDVPDDDARLLEAGTGSDGRFRFSGLLPGAYGMSVYGPGDSRSYGTTHRRGIEAGADDVVVVLGEGPSITGRVVDDAGEPVRRFTVEAIPRLVEGGPGRRAHHASDSDDGRFAMLGMPAGTWEVSARSESRGRSESVQVTLPDEGRLEFVLGRGCVLSGTMRDPLGRPVPGAQLHVSQELGQRTVVPTGPARALADAGGRFRVEDVAPGPVRVAAAGPGWSPSATLSLELGSGERRDGLALELRPESRVRVLVVDPGGAPAGDVDVELSRERFRATVRTREDGLAEFGELTPGRYELEGRSARGTDGEWLSVRRHVDVRPGVALEERLRVARGGPRVTISGVVTANGRPLASTCLHAQIGQRAVGRTATDADGRYSLSLGPADEVDLEIGRSRTHELLAVRRAPASASGVLDIDLEVGTVAGMVVDETGQRVAGALVRIESPDGRASLQALSDPAGRFRFETVVAGTLDVRTGGAAEERATTPGALGPARSVQLGAGETLELELRARRGVSLEGVVRDVHGSPVERAELLLWDAAGVPIETGLPARTSAGGRFRLYGLPAEPVTIAARGRWLASGRIVADLASGSPPRIELVAEAALAVRVLVVDGDGIPVDGASVRLLDSGGRAYPRDDTSTSNLGPGVHFGPLPAGRYELRATADGRSSSSTLDVPRARTLMRTLHGNVNSWGSVEVATEIVLER